MEKYLSTTNNVGSFLTILFGFTGGVIALVGLIAIFVSLNSQQSFQKCRELYWNMVSMSFNNEFKEFYSTFSLYESIYYESPNEELTLKIVNIARFAIWSVASVWTALTIYLITQFNIGEYSIIFIALIFSIFILLRFSKYLLGLKSIIGESSLPSPQEILDSREIMNTKINTYGALLSTLEIITNYRDSGETGDLELEERESFGEKPKPVRIMELYLSFPYEISFLDIRLITVEHKDKVSLSRICQSENIVINENKLVDYKIFSNTNNFLYKICTYKELKDCYYFDYFGNHLEFRFDFIVNEKISNKYLVTSKFDTKSRFGYIIDSNPEIESKYISRNFTESTENKKVFI